MNRPRVSLAALAALTSDDGISDDLDTLDALRIAATTRYADSVPLRVIHPQRVRRVHA